jgi:U1 small nuclear ribonucleoprotein C
MPRFYCEYCEIFLTHSSAHGRRQHNSGRKHIMCVIDYYANYQLQLRDQAGAPLPAGFAAGALAACAATLCARAASARPQARALIIRAPGATRRSPAAGVSVGMPAPPPLPQPGAASSMFGNLPAAPPMPFAPPRPGMGMPGMGGMPGAMPGMMPPMQPSYGYGPPPPMMQQPPPMQQPPNMGGGGGGLAALFGVGPPPGGQPRY